MGMDQPLIESIVALPNNDVKSIKPVRKGVWSPKIERLPHSNCNWRIYYQGFIWEWEREGRGWEEEVYSYSSWNKILPPPPKGNHALPLSQRELIPFKEEFSLLL